MSIKFINDRRLYTDYMYCQSHFDWDDYNEEPQLLIYHCYWRGRLTRHHELSLKSLMITQSHPYEIWVWMSPDDIAQNHSFTLSFENIPGIRFISYIYESEAEGTLLERCDREIINTHNPLTFSDIFRLLALGKYGGVYFDLDVLFLKDLRPLCNVEYFYQWSNQPYGNHAITHFSKNSPNIWLLVERSLNLRSFHPARLLLFSEIVDLLEDVYVFPTFLFDPLWIAHDTETSINTYCNKFQEFFTNETPITWGEIFPGAYTYHWHNQWDRPIHKSTIIGQVYDDVILRFNAMYQLNEHGIN